MIDLQAGAPLGAEVELTRFEALRAGDTRAFESLLAEHLGGLSGFARCYAPAADALVTRAVAAFLAGIDVFAWRCSLRSWLYGLLADAGRAAGPRTVEGIPPSAPARPLTGPGDWSDLPWGPRWSEHAWSVAAGALARLPLATREVVWLSDVAGWPAQEVWDAVACTHVRGEALLAAGRGVVRDALATLIAAPEPDPVTRARQTAAAARLLADLAPPAGPVDVPPALRRLFRRWRADRRRFRLRRFGRPAARAAPDNALRALLPTE